MKDAEIASLRSQIANKNSEIANLRAEVSKLEGRMNQTCPSCEKLKSLLATERDAFGKRETEMMGEIKASRSREAKLVEVLKEIADPEGHGANPDDWEPMEIAQEALAAHKKEKP